MFKSLKWCVFLGFRHFSMFYFYFHSWGKREEELDMTQNQVSVNCTKIYSNMAQILTLCVFACLPVLPVFACLCL